MRPFAAFRQTLRTVSNRRRRHSRFRLQIESLEDRTVPALDPTFGVAGKQAIDFGDNSESGQEVVIQPDGKIVVSGQTYANATGGDFAVTRLNRDGSLDTLFNGTGKQTVDFGAPGGDYGQSVALQADGKILVAGYGDSWNQGGGYFDCFEDFIQRTWYAIV